MSIPWTIVYSCTPHFIMHKLLTGWRGCCNNFMIPSQICKSKQGEGVIECSTAAPGFVLCLTWASLIDSSWELMADSHFIWFELSVSHNSLICTKFQYLSLWGLSDLSLCVELSQLLFVSHLRENYCNAQCSFDFLEIPENQMQIKCLDPAQSFYSIKQKTILTNALGEKDW